MTFVDNFYARILLIYTVACRLIKVHARDCNKSVLACPIFGCTRRICAGARCHIVRYPFALNWSVWFLLYRQKMSPRVSDWKSQGETRTTSPIRIHTRRFSLPLTLHNRSLPSWHLTRIRSKPSIFIAVPNTSLALGNTMFARLSSLITFLFPNSSPPNG